VNRSRSPYRAIVAKDLKSELRTLRSLPAMVLFAVTTFVIFRFGLDRTALSGSLAAGVLMTTLLFAAILGINRIFLAEREEGGFDAFRLSPVERPVLFAAKATVLFLYMTAVELVAVPVFAVFFLPAWAGLAPLVAVLAGMNLGLAALGTLISSMAVNSRARDLLVPLVLLPLAIPLMIAATGAAALLLDATGPEYSGIGPRLVFLALYDGIFCLVGYAVFDFLLED